MKPIDNDHLANVTGGFGALLGAALQAAPGILNGVAGIIGAAKSGGKGAAPTQAAAAAAPVGPAPAPAPLPAPGDGWAPKITTNVQIS